MRVYSKSYRTRRNGTADRGKSIRHLRAAAAAARVEVLLVSKAVLLLRLHTATAPAADATTTTTTTTSIARIVAAIRPRRWRATGVLALITRALSEAQNV